MKLYICSANAVDYEPTGIIVAETEKEAQEKFEKELDDDGIWYAGTVWVEEVEVKGYEIIVKEKE